MTDLTHSHKQALTNLYDASVDLRKNIDGMTLSRQVIRRGLTAMEETLKSFGVTGDSFVQHDKREVLEPQMVEIDKGLRLTRRAIFSSKINEPAWQWDMLVAIVTAAKMGATRYEIEISGEIEKPKQRGMSVYDMFMGPGYSRYNNDDRDVASVTVFAMVIE